MVVGTLNDDIKLIVDNLKTSKYQRPDEQTCTTSMQMYSRSSGAVARDFSFTQSQMLMVRLRDKGDFEVYMRTIV